MVNLLQLLIMEMVNVIISPLKLLMVRPMSLNWTIRKEIKKIPTKEMARVKGKMVKAKPRISLNPLLS